MSWLVIVALAGATPDASAAPTDVRSVQEAARILASQVQTGTLLVSEGDCLAVQAYTRSPFTHVGAVVMRHGQPFVYDASKSTGVRCSTLANYLKTQIDHEVHVLQPRTEFSDDGAGDFARRLDSQLGRPYSVRHHLTGESVEGVHCAEYVSDALATCRVIKVRNAANVSPASLVRGITRSKIYEPLRTVRIAEATAALEPTATTWYGRLWQDTRSCTANCYRQTRAWFVCD